MKIAIMQPYIFPYIGYFQLIQAVDNFVLYDNIEFTKKGWINRNRILVNGKDEFVSLPLKKDSDYKHIVQRQLADTWATDKLKILNKIKGAYSKAPQYATVLPLIEGCLNYNNTNLYYFIANAIKNICNYLGITTTITTSSSLAINHSLKSEEKVLAISNHLGATTYINPIGGLGLYSKPTFANSNIELQFLKTKAFDYKQFKNEFIPYLSIIDVLMCNDLPTVQQMLTQQFEII